jgi:hypothetical protein
MQVLVACTIASQAAHSLERTDGSSESESASRECRAGETLFQVIKTTRIRGGIRVDYQFVETGAAGWANMDSALLRKFRIKVGATFCMLDIGDAANSPVDND